MRRLPLKKLAALSVLPAALVSAPALAIGDGARAYQLVPAGTRIASAYGIFLDGNAALDPSTPIEGANISVDVVALQFTQSVTIGGQVTGLFAILPVGRVDGSLTVDRPLRPPVTLTGDSSGIGDIQLGGVFGLVGSPALGLREYVAHKPGFALGALARVTIPTGAYSSDQAINLGTNRWAVQLGAPLGYVVGASMLDPALMTFELIPSATFFTVNTDPFGADRTSQAPIFKLEAHATRNINKALWLGVDAVAKAGGKTKTDGIDDDNSQSSLELGATVGMNLSKSFALKATYGGVVARNSNGLDGTGFRIVATAIF